jgi:hypothetical protein
MDDANKILTAWLRQRIGPGQMVFATGSLDSSNKYKSLRADYVPNLVAYLVGDREHIYGSRLRDARGNTMMLCFEIDQPEYNARAFEYQVELARAGISSIYWQRGHLEIYLDRTVDPDAGRAWCQQQCPALAKIPECYPAKGRYNHPLSWPLYQRIGDEILVCVGSVVLAADPTTRLEVTIEDRPRLASAIRATVVDASPVEAVAASIREQKEAEARSRAALEEQRRAAAPRQAKAVPDRTRRQDLAKQVARSFNESHSWQEIADLCGGMENGRFKAVWRHEESASVVPDRSVGGRESAYARDYGATGTWPAKFDKYQAWCMAKGLDKRVDLGDRISALRAQLASQEQAQAERAKPKSPGSQVDSQPEPEPAIQEASARVPTYNEMCDYMEQWGAEHQYPAVAIVHAGNQVAIKAGEREWKRWFLVGLATREQRQAMYEHLVRLE